MGRGIDYGMGQTNIDTATGIRFGIIPQNALAGWVMGEAVAEYGDPACPECGCGVIDYSAAVEKIEKGEAEGVSDEGELSNYRKHSCSDYACLTCGIILGSDEVYGDEPKGWVLANDDLKARGDTDGDVWVFKSPYFTRAAFCSPCAPGACHLSSPCDDGEKCYCLGHEWFEGEVAPYPVYSVATGELVPSPKGWSELGWSELG